MNTKLNIGVLIPQSKAYPLMGKEFVNGLKLGLDYSTDVNLKVESIGLGEDPNQLINIIQKQINQEDVKLFTGLLGHFRLDQIADFVSANEVPLIYSDLGASSPITARDFVYSNSFDLYGSTLKIGQYFSDQNINNIVTSTCYYEAGYSFIEGLESALKENQNTSFSGHFITPLNPRENEAEIMRQWMMDINPDAVFAFHNGVFAKEHADYLSINKLYKEFSIYTLPYSVDQKLLDEFPNVFECVKSISSWFPELKSHENQLFVSKYKLEFKKTPSSFALLGYENGLMIRSALNFKANENSTTINQNIKSLNLEGPRGQISFETENNRTEFGHYIWKIIKSESGQMIREIEKKIEPIESIIIPKTKTENGWYNAYLCH